MAFISDLTAWATRKIANRQGSATAAERLLRATDTTSLDPAPAAASLPAELLSASPGATVAPEIPQTYTFLCIPTAKSTAEYGWNSSEDILDSTSKYSGTWYSPIVQVTESGHTWGVDCLDAGSPLGYPQYRANAYWWNADKTSFMSTNYRLTTPASGSLGYTYYIWENQSLVSSTSKTALITACRVTISGTDYYRWLEDENLVKSIPVAGGSVSTITLSPNNGGRHAEFSHDGKKLLQTYSLSSSPYQTHEYDLGENLSGSVTGTLLSEDDFSYDSYSNTVTSGTSGGAISYSGTFKKPIGAGYDDNDSAVVLTLCIKEECTATYKNSVTEGTSQGGIACGPATTWPGIYAPTGFTPSSACAGNPATQYVMFYLTPYLEESVSLSRTLWFEQNGTPVGTPLTIASYERDTVESVFQAPHQVWLLCDGYPVCDHVYASGYDISCIDVDCETDRWANFCPSCWGDLDPNDHVTTTVAEAYHILGLTIDRSSIDAPGGTAVLVCAGSESYSRQQVSGFDYTPEGSELGEVDDLTVTARLLTGAAHPIGAMGSYAQGNQSFDRAAAESLAVLQTRLEDAADIVDFSKATSRAIARTLSSGITAWSAQSFFSSGTPGQYTEIDGEVPTWMPSGGSLAGGYRSAIIETACSP